MKKIILSKALKEYYGSPDRIKTSGPNCLSIETMVDYVAKDLSEEKMKRVEKHIDSCESCLSQVYQISEIYKSLNEKTENVEVSEIMLEKFQKAFLSGLQNKKDKNILWRIVADSSEIISLQIPAFIKLLKPRSFENLNGSIEIDKKSYCEIVVGRVFNNKVRFVFKNKTQVSDSIRVTFGYDIKKIAANETVEFEVSAGEYNVNIECGKKIEFKVVVEDNRPHIDVNPIIDVNTLR